MESKKVKEIKECLEEFKDDRIGYYTNGINRFMLTKEDILTYINELESENKDLQDLCNKTYDDLTKEIDRLEKENVELKVDLKNSIDMQKQMLDGFKTIIKEVEENLAREIPNLLKQFAERLKEKAVYFGKHDCEHNAVKVRTINETLKEFLKGENNE